MSSSSQERHAEVPGELGRELRQFNGLGAAFFRVAAARAGMTVTDMQVIDLLDSAGSSTAGQLADLTGLTTGAITGMLNRLEEAGLVRRERDPNDGRRVIVQITPDRNKMREIDQVFTSLEQGWEEMISDYDAEQLAFLLAFLKRSNALSRQEIVRLREAPESNQKSISVPLGELTSARLVIPSSLSSLTLRADKALTELCSAHFEGTVPEVKTRDGVVTIRYPRHRWVLGMGQREAEMLLNTTLPWQITLQGGVSTLSAELDDLLLAGLEIKGGLSSIRLALPMPATVVPVQISGGVSTISIRRPAGVAARVHLKGWASTFVFDNQTFNNLGNDIRLQSADFEAAAQYYDIEVASSVSSVTITAE